MSGPKVVRVVTREELAVRCQAAMAGLRAVARALESRLRNEGNQAQAVAALAGRLQAVADDLAALRVNGLEARIQALTTFVRGEIDRIDSEAAKRAERKRQNDRRMLDTARALARALGQNSASGPALVKALDAAKGFEQSALDQLGSATEAAYSELKGRLQTESKARADVGMASRLLAGQDNTLVRWAADNAVEAKADARIERLLAQMQVLGENVSPLARRAYDLAQAEDSNDKAARVDSLVLELAEAASRAGRLATLKAKAASLKESLSTLVGNFDRLARDLEQVIAGSDEVALKRAIDQAEQALEKSLADTAATARRRAVLDGLKGLGYAVHESMETAWVKNGRVVLSRPDDQDYGVELGANPDAANMQVRLVGVARPSKPRSSQRDTAVEQKWCSEFERLRQHAATLGTQIEIKRAEGVGAVPVRTVENADLERARIADVARSSPQTLKK